MIYLYDRVHQVTATSGVGTITLATSASLSGEFQKFEDVLSNGQKTYYTIQNADQWEVGLGTYSSNTLSRDTILDSSSGVGSGINIYRQSQVFITYPARKSVVVDDNSIASGNYTGVWFPNGVIQSVAFTGQGVGTAGSGLVLVNDVEFNVYGGTGNFKQILFNSTNPVLVGYSTVAASKGLSVGDDAGTSSSVGEEVNIGYQAAKSASDNGYSVNIGSKAGSNSSTNTTAVNLGFQAGLDASNNQTTINIGSNAGRSSFNERNVIIGENAGYASSGTKNILIGRDIGRASSSANISGSHNLDIRTNSERTSSSNINIGSNNNKIVIQGMIVGDSSSKKLSIGNCTSGDFNPDATLEIHPAATTNIGLIVQGIASQSANLQEWQNSSEFVLTRIDANGNFATSGNISTRSGIILPSQVPTVTTNKVYNSGGSLFFNGSAIGGGGGAGGYNWKVGVSGVTDTVTSGQTVTFTGLGNTSIFYNASSNIVSISGADQSLSSYATISFVNNVSGELQTGINSLNTATGSLDTRVTANTAASGHLQGKITSNDTDIAALKTSTGLLNTDVSALETATGNLDTRVTANDSDLTAVSGLLYKNWNLNVSGSNDSITKNQTVTFTGIGNSAVSYNASTNTVTISGSSAGGGGGDYNWKVGVSGVTDTITSGQTVTFTGLGHTSVFYNPSTNIVSISGTDQALGSYATISYVNNVSGELQTGINNLNTATGLLNTDVAALKTATGNLDTRVTANDSDITAVSGLLYKNWVLNVSGSNDSITKTQTVTFTGIGTSSVSYNQSTNTVTISGSPHDGSGGGGGAGGYNWKVGVSGATDTITSGQTVTFTGLGHTSVLYNPSTNIVSISGADQSLSSYATISYVNNVSGELQTGINNLNTATGLLNTDVSSLKTATGNLDTRVTANAAFNTAASGYLQGQITVNAASSGFLQTQITSNDTDITALKTATGNLDTRVTTNTSNISTVSGLINTYTAGSGLTLDGSEFNVYGGSGQFLKLEVENNINSTGLITAHTGVHLDRNTPSPTTDTLYNVGGSLYFNGSTVGGGSPGGSNTQIQFNDSSSFGGDSDLTWNKTTNVLTINGTLMASLKSFVIDHPTKEGMKLQYGSLEGPENGVYVRGIIEDGNIIELPDYWIGLVDGDSITVQLTPTQYSQPNLFVDKIQNNKIYLSSDKNINAYYIIQATRKDVDPLEVEWPK